MFASPDSRDDQGSPVTIATRHMEQGAAGGGAGGSARGGGGRDTTTTNVTHTNTIINATPGSPTTSAHPFTRLRHRLQRNQPPPPPSTYAFGCALPDPLRFMYVFCSVDIFVGNDQR